MKRINEGRVQRHRGIVEFCRRRGHPLEFPGDGIKSKERVFISFSGGEKIGAVFHFLLIERAIVRSERPEIPARVNGPEKRIAENAEFIGCRIIQLRGLADCCAVTADTAENNGFAVGGRQHQRPRPRDRKGISQ